MGFLKLGVGFFNYSSKTIILRWKANFGGLTRSKHIENTRLSCKGKCY